MWLIRSAAAHSLFRTGLMIGPGAGRSGRLPYGVRSSLLKFGRKKRLRFFVANYSCHLTRVVSVSKLSFHVFNLYYLYIYFTKRIAFLISVVIFLIINFFVFKYSVIFLYC